MTNSLPYMIKFSEWVGPKIQYNRYLGLALGLIPSFGAVSSFVSLNLLVVGMDVRRVIATIRKSNKEYEALTAYQTLDAQLSLEFKEAQAFLYDSMEDAPAQLEDENENENGEKEGNKNETVLEKALREMMAEQEERKKVEEGKNYNQYKFDQKTEFADGSITFKEGDDITILKLISAFGTNAETLYIYDQVEKNKILRQMLEEKEQTQLMSMDQAILVQKEL